MPNVSDLFKFSEYSDRKKFTILVVGLVLYFGWINDGNVKLANGSKDEKYNSLKELYNEQRNDNKELRKENKMLMLENGSLIKNENPRMDSINADLKFIKEKLNLK